MRRRNRAVRRSTRNGKNLIWVTTLIESSFLEATPLDLADLVIPSDWAGAAGFDRATLMGVRGWLNIAQVAAATAADASGVWVAIYVTGTDIPANSFNPGAAVDYNDNDTLYTTGAALTTTTGTGVPQPAEQIWIKARRRLTTAQDLRIAAIASSDTATPRVNVIGCIRSLIMTD